MSSDVGLEADSVVNVTQLATIDRAALEQCLGALAAQPVKARAIPIRFDEPIVEPLLAASLRRKSLFTGGQRAR